MSKIKIQTTYVAVSSFKLARGFTDFLTSTFETLPKAHIVNKDPTHRTGM